LRPRNRGGAEVFEAVLSPDGWLIARGIAPDQLRLAGAATGRELARLTTLQPILPAPLAFSRDGTKLITHTTRQTALVCALRWLRDELARMGLDRDAPPYPVVLTASEAPAPVPSPRPVRVIGKVIKLRARRRTGRDEPLARRQS
jgi:hypothetical protein